MSVLDARLRLLYVFKILMEKTDKDHYLNAEQIMEMLKVYNMEYEDYNLVPERRGIYNDIKALTMMGDELGIEIETVPRNKGWRVKTRNFEDPELKLLADAVRGAKFIPAEKTRELIGKLQQLTSVYSARELQRVTITVDEKNNNKAMMSIVDVINDAMNHNRQITFKYVEITVDKEEIYRREGKPYIVSPWSLIWNNEYYYLLAHDPETDGIKHYRVDRIREIEILEKKKREGHEVYKKYHPSFTKKTFGMYGGEDLDVRLRCRNDMTGVVIDRFGSDNIFVPDGEEHFLVRVKITISPQFFGWLVAVGDAIELKGPGTLRQEYKQYLENILQKY